MGNKFVLPNFRDSLKQRGTVQMLTVGREAAIEVQVRLIDYNIMIHLSFLVFLQIIKEINKQTFLCSLLWEHWIHAWDTLQATQLSCFRIFWSPQH